MDHKNLLVDYILGLTKDGFEITFAYPPPASFSDGLRIEMRHGDYRKVEIIEYEKFSISTSSDIIIYIYLVAMHAAICDEINKEIMEDNHG